ncbi:MAG: hypothetical protein DRN27_09445 [Thermoplasmata archaeon]|nr:MAG: hypothetical protein DRN27_09445 [Thermoplasmata archaeon]
MDILMKLGVIMRPKHLTKIGVKRLYGLVSMVQTKLTKITKIDGSWDPDCPNCGRKMELVWWGKSKPPPKWNFGEIIDHWNYISPRVDAD